MKNPLCLFGIHLRREWWSSPGLLLRIRRCRDCGKTLGHEFISVEGEW
ncbi:hypothetical protein [Gordonia sp. N1V]|nr:hypothetical protein [Gordonia sp. N1V]MDF3280888.1 hypothetical protein [Gordonia sp. N1V]